MKSGKALARTLVVIASLLLQHTAEGQTNETQHPSKLSLKVFSGGPAPSYYPLGDEAKSGWAAEIKGFRRLPSARWLSGPPVESLRLCFSREGARAARVKVYALREGDAALGGTLVSEHLVWEGQEHSVTQLAAHGVEPLRLGLVRRAEVKLSPPDVQSGTRAVEVVKVEVREKLPSFELTLRNVSEKEIRAVEIREMRGWIPKGDAPLYDWKAMSLIKPGESWKVTIEFGWNRSLTAAGHAVEPPDKVFISTVLFSDGSYEGQPSFAAKAEAFKTGRRALLARALELMPEWGDYLAADDRDGARALAAQIEALDCTAEWSAVVELAGRYPSLLGGELDDIKSSLEAGMQWQRAFLLREFKGFITSEEPAGDLSKPRRWLTGRREAYAKLLARI